MTDESEQKNIPMPVRQLLIVAAEVSSLANEYERASNSSDLPQLLVDLLRDGDARVRAIPMPFPTVLVHELIDLHAFGALYELGFSRASTISMVFDTQDGNILNLEVPSAIEPYAPHLVMNRAEGDGADKE